MNLQDVLSVVDHGGTLVLAVIVWLELRGVQFQLRQISEYMARLGYHEQPRTIGKTVRLG